MHIFLIRSDYPRKRPFSMINLNFFLFFYTTPMVLWAEILRVNIHFVIYKSRIMYNQRPVFL